MCGNVADLRGRVHESGHQGHAAIGRPELVSFGLLQVARRNIITTCGSFQSDEAATKLLFLAIRNTGVH